MDKHDLYELAVQDPARSIPFLRSLHGREPRILGEDFCGTAALARAWVRARLRAHGVFACDTYGGATAYTQGALSRDRFLPDGTHVRYVWEQRAADPRTGMVVNAIHFRVERDERVILELPDAFVYRWRLWALPELCDALRDAGFRSVAVYDAIPGIGERADGSPDPIEPASQLDATFVVCVAAR